VSDVLVVLSTFPSADKAAEVARTLVDERLCACVNIVPAVRSIYRWEGKVFDDTETLALIKTTRAGYGALEARLLALHPYELPEVVAFEPQGGSAAYLAWVAGEVR
jgi:periplasmic divalent cation tolerance protein